MVIIINRVAAAAMAPIWGAAGNCLLFIGENGKIDRTEWKCSKNCLSFLNEKKGKGLPIEGN